MNSNYIYAITLCLSLCFSCKPAKTNSAQKLTFAFSETYTLDDNESELPLNDNVLVAYDTFQYGDDINLPLNKYIKGENHHIFIAAAIENSKDEVLQKLTNAYDSKYLLNQKKDPKFVQFLLKQNDIFVTQAVYSEKIKHIPIVVSMLSKDSILIKNAYDTNKLVSKIN